MTIFDTDIPSDSELQEMTYSKLKKLWERRPTYSANMEWVRVAKEIRYRERFGLVTD